MTQKLHCPCGCKKFSVMAHVTEEWIVDEDGEFLERGSCDVGDVTHRPRVGNNDFHFICDECGADAVVVEVPEEEPCQSP
jgi:hypothetical protein